MGFVNTHGDASATGHKMNSSDSPPIIAQTVTLRLFVPEDASKALVMSQESGSRMWLPDQVYENEAGALEAMLYLIEKCHDPGMPSVGPYVLGVCLNDTRELIGHVGLSPFKGEVEIGYAIEDVHQGKGLAAQAVRAMSDWGLARFALPRILGIVSAENVASCRVLQRAGFDLVEEWMGKLHGRSGLIRQYEKVSQIAN